ncbi:hypothetical protein P7C71_g1492, partial [Lecanoromycetidae sp. Uapishka_2]
MALPLKEQLEQLEAARQIVLGDSALYPQIVQGILPIVGANARLELRRWGAEFMAETFASPAFPAVPKEHSAVGVLGTLKDLLEIPGEDAAVVKSVVQTVASIYALVFHYIDAVLINATLNALGTLLRTRQSTANKILTAILNFNPLKQANSPMSPTSKVQIKSMERTTRALLLNIYRRNENGPFAPRIKAYVDRMTQIRLDIFDEGGRKRGYPSEPTDGLDNNKRRCLGAELPGKEAPQIATLPPGPVSLKQLFTLTNDYDLTNFHVEVLPLDLMMNITLPILARVDQQSLNEALTVVRSRLHTATTQNPGLSHTGALGDDEEDYEPNFEPREDREQTLNRADALPPEDSPYNPAEVVLGPFTLPPPPPLTAESAEEIGKGTIGRVFDIMRRLDEPAAAKNQKSGLNRLAGSNYDKEAWITVVTRLATRASAGLDEDSDEEEDSKTESETVSKKQVGGSSLSDGIRQELWRFIMEDFRARIPVAISWLNEEWFNDQIQSRASEQRKHGEALPKPKSHYVKWTLKLLDSIMPYLDAKDKLLIRFLSEIPEVNEEVLKRVKSLARDPERVQLAVNTLLYLIMVKPPARDMSLDALEDLWRNYDDAKAPAAKHLVKWRPQVLALDIKPNKESNLNGIKIEGPRSPPPQAITSTSTRAESEQMEQNQASLPVAAAG